MLFYNLMATSSALLHRSNIVCATSEVAHLENAPETQVDRSGNCFCVAHMCNAASTTIHT